MIILFNANSYLGGGEVLLINIAKFYAPKERVLVITKTNSYIYDQLKNTQNVTLILLDQVDYIYMSQKNQRKYVDHLVAEIERHRDGAGKSTVVTFCFRDLYPTMFIIKQCQNIAPLHLLLHPLDHLYATQSVRDKLVAKLFGNQKFSLTHIKETNKYILNILAKSGNVISMNSNVSNRVQQDFGISIDRVVPLPVCENISEKELTKLDANLTKKIIWIGRFVDFKLPSIYAMIDFLAENKAYHFELIGYGEEDKVKKHIKKKRSPDLESRVTFHGKVDNEKLDQIIKPGVIGYAMGTSCVEFAMRGIPVIVATASPNGALFDRAVCSGGFIDQEPGNVGDDLYQKGVVNVLYIKDIIKKIVADYASAALSSSSYVRTNYSKDINILKYDIKGVECIVSADSSMEKSVPFLKRIIYASGLL